jgi:hypothetical protein
MRRVLSVLAAIALSIPALAGELAGVTLPDSVSAGDTTLVLNGMGLRKKAIFKVYVGALYLPAKSGDAAAVIALDAPKRMVMHFLRDVDGTAVADAWKEGFANNSAAKLPALQQRLDNFASLWSDVKTGDEVTMTYVPAVGLKLAIRGKEVGLIVGKDFADAVMACWLGDKPPSEDLKNGVLGR